MANFNRFNKRQRNLIPLIAVAFACTICQIFDMFGGSSMSNAVTPKVTMTQSTDMTLTSVASQVQPQTLRIKIISQDEFKKPKEMQAATRTKLEPEAMLGVPAVPVAAPVPLPQAQPQIPVKQSTSSTSFFSQLVKKIKDKINDWKKDNQVKPVRSVSPPVVPSVVPSPIQAAPQTLLPPPIKAEPTVVEKSATSNDVFYSAANKQELKKLLGELQKNAVLRQLRIANGQHQVESKESEVKIVNKQSIYQQNSSAKTHVAEPVIVVHHTKFAAETGARRKNNYE